STKDSLEDEEEGEKKKTSGRQISIHINLSQNLYREKETNQLGPTDHLYEEEKEKKNVLPSFSLSPKRLHEQGEKERCRDVNPLWRRRRGSLTVLRRDLFDPPSCQQK
ncbi:hypothetical protein CSUI_008092, partial [Cystoisospora suis]